ncbi:MULTISPECIES: phosphoribosyl-ATP diphosphatase [unclassified Ochrobactrum]|jgi:phosphoribosyl-ATP pyrophosphohydrolase|uniref:phosphoribosyl-ATP diphosphatase n=1 Tax=Brucella/Ochrobactrum group TaxID=2826938 RepID=UPI0009948BF1|nr:phosphoribosyl-ATP diphosphatase [Ochrobactrum sp. Kaboul]MBA8818031.1 phosphoribosyl-ATP pyrophosphohydrolase [Ochrobactrum sp. P6BSIII]MBA8836926.1 phosphoribosyl-ATP pyrophosphohydrolase [Ochrobactrum sp. RH2CCR150]MDH7784213.1 phosphoribosyl-ATP pyrophosphohydrolase [Ochrobactrum sp. 19YEA23]OOL19231.1 phosphoribosyl-ATP diphosphatase [Ochrobactrum sp. P6BS-III]URQ74845.1 MAG: phosphoribosyl-ATP diphosphatase [Candidatus Ochrobactrum gambitense]
MSQFTLADLERIVAERASVTDGSSYTASLVARGPNKASQKLGEEAVETVIAAVSGDRAGVVSESADLLYHLMVVWKIAGVPLEEVLQELDRRTGQTGLEEKAARPKA